MSTIATVSNEVKEPKVESGEAFSSLWLIYFILSIGFLGIFFAYAVTVPLCILGRAFRPAWKVGGRTLAYGVRFLFKCQPWLNTDVRIQLPRKGSFVTYSNHRSHLDMFILLSQIPNLRVISKSVLFHIPLLGVMMRVLKQIPLKKQNPDSYRKAFATSLQAIRAGDAVHFFPEMTRCAKDFAGTQDFHLTPFQIMLEAGAPIYPVVFHDSDRVWPKGRNALSFGKTVKVRTLAPLFPSEFNSAAELRRVARERMDAALTSL